MAETLTGAAYGIEIPPGDVEALRSSAGRLDELASHIGEELRRATTERTGLSGTWGGLAAANYQKTATDLELGLRTLEAHIHEASGAIHTYASALETSKAGAREAIRIASDAESTWQELQRWAEVEIAALTAAESVAAAVAGTTAPVAASLIADIERQLQQGYDTYRSELARARDRAEQEWNTLRHVIKWLENLLSGQHARKPPTLHGEPIPMGPVSTMPSLLQVPINKLPMNKLGPGITPQTNFQDNVVSIADGYVGQSSGGVPGCSGTGGEWCAMFVNSVLCQALGYTKSQAETEKLLGGGTASVATWANAALTGKPLITGANGEQYKLVPLPAGAAPQPGDLIAYYTPTNGGLPTADTWNLTGPGWHHIGIVKSYSGTSVSAIQGNWGNASLTNYKVRNDPPPLAGNLTSPVSASIDGKQESLATYQRHDGLGWDAIILKLEPVNPPPG